MTSYALTVHFDAEPESMTMFHEMTGEQIVAFLPITKKQMRQKGIAITSFSLDILDENGKPRVLPECEEIVTLKVGRFVTRQGRRVQ